MNKYFQLAAGAATGLLASGALIYVEAPDAIAKSAGQAQMLISLGMAGATAALAGASSMWKRFKAEMAVHQQIDSLQQDVRKGACVDDCTLQKFNDLTQNAAQTFSQARQSKRNAVLIRMHELRDCISQANPAAASALGQAMAGVAMELGGISNLQNSQKRVEPTLDLSAGSTLYVAQGPGMGS